MADATITGLFVYPVKSFGGIALSESAVEKRGLKHDRRWMLVDEDGLFMTQRTDTRLALFRTAIEIGELRITSHTGEERCVPFEARGKKRVVRIWKDTCEGVQVCEELDAWLSGQLGTRCSLIYMPDEMIRSTNPEFTIPGDMVGFADGYPVLVVGESSLAELNSKLDAPLPMNRFRANITVKGWEPHEEDGWRKLRVGNLTLRAAKQCARCSVPATDQETGEVGVEPLRALAKYRLKDQKIYFGAYYVPEQCGTLRVGDTIVGNEG